MSKYFAADDVDKTVDTLHRKASEWFNTVLENNYLEKLKDSVDAYHGNYYEDGHKITYGGEQGELVNLAVNHYRNIATHMKNMVTANRPSFQARATNADAKSEIQTELANGLLDYYMREKRLERYLNKAVEYAIVLGAGYIKMDWNSTTGEIYDYVEGDPEKDQDTGEMVTPEPVPIYEGDVVFRNMSPFDVVFDSSKESSEEHDWVLCRTFKNKYDLAAKYPEQAEEIQAVRTKTELERQRIQMQSFYEKTEDVPVYEFYHKKTESVPNGRYILYLTPEIILEDTIMMYRDLPVFRISASDILGTPYGYTQMFDLIPLQQSINSLYSTIITNQSAFGVQNILNPRGNDVRLNSLEGAMNFIEYTPIPNSASGGRPEALNLTQTPPEIFNFIQMLVRDMETISGINSVARGNPDKALTSGVSLALVQSQALQFMSGLQQSYIQLIEDVGTGMVNLLRDFASVPRVAAIAGINSKSKMVSFTGDDLNSVNRVIVDVSNPLSNTTAGRVQMAEQLLQMKLIDSPEKYLEVMNTGKLTTMTQGATDELITVRLENESLLTGGAEVFAVYSDKHSLHVREHRNVLADPYVRMNNPELIQRTLDHIQQHIELLQTTDPNILALFGEQPLGPPAGSPVAPGTVAPGQPSANAMGDASGAMMAPEAGGVGAGAAKLPVPGETQGKILPQPAQPPKVAQNGLPVDPKDT